MDRLGEIDVLLLGAVPQELSALSEALESCREIAFRGQVIWWGRYADLSVLMGTTGLGKVNAAITTVSLLQRFAVKQVWHLGCAGAYAEGPLEIGDVIITETALCGDEGVLTEEGVLSGAQIGIPILVHLGKVFFDQVPSVWNATLRKLIEKTPAGLYRQEEGHPFAPAHCCEGFNLPIFKGAAKTDGIITPLEVPSPPSPLGEKRDSECFHLVYGPSLTVGMASGDPRVASERYRRYGAYAENMEGSAVAQACCRFETPLLECRGISNRAGTRAKETWELEKAVAHCQGIIINWLDTLNSLQLSP